MKKNPNSRARALFSFVFIIAALCFALDMLMGTPCFANISGSGFCMASAIGLATIDDVNDRETSGGAIAYEIYLVEVHQLDAAKFNLKMEISEEGARGTTGKPVLASTEKAVKMVAHDIPTLLTNIEKGDITTTGTNTFTVVLGNPNRDVVANFIEYQQGGRFLLFYHHIEEEEWYVLGTKDRPVIFSAAEAKDDKDGRYATCTFTRNSTNLPYPYTGSLPADFTATT